MTIILKRFKTEAEAQTEANKDTSTYVRHTSFVLDPWAVCKKAAEGLCLNLHMYSDSKAFRITRMTPSGKTAYVRRVQATKDPEWKPETVPGGFAGHTTNNREQRWVYGDLVGPEIAVRQTKKGWRSKLGNHSLSEEPFEFYDYNF